MASVITLNSKKKDEYSITISKGLIDSVGKLTKPLTKAKRITIVSDTNVFALYGERVVKSFEDAGFEVSSFCFSAGEPSKNLNTVTDIIEAFCKAGLTRQDLAVALGGGVVGDLTGFASAIYLRGIGFVQIPTSLLAQIDSSVGGKTGCDLNFGKNLCGAFHNPLAVFIDPEVLSTLSEKYFNDGLAEAIKAGAIKLPLLFECFETCKEIDLQKIIYQSVKMKADVVEKDFTEQGERTLLNFGHTLGHAIERFENYSGHSHGEAVAIGMVLITKASEKAGLTEVGTTKRLITCLENFSLPTKTDISLKKLCELSFTDKKSVDDSIKLVVLKTIGEALVYEIEKEKLFDFINC